MASNFQQQSQSGLNKHFTTLSLCLSELDKMKDNFAEVKVPANVFNYIDEGKNPLLYTKDCLITTLKKNEEIKGKIDTFKQFRELLLDEFNKNFPEEHEAYMKIKQADEQQQQTDLVQDENEKKDE